MLHKGHVSLGAARENQVLSAFIAATWFLWLIATVSNNSNLLLLALTLLCFKSRCTPKASCAHRWESWKVIGLWRFITDMMLECGILSEGTDHRGWGLEGFMSFPDSSLGALCFLSAMWWQILLCYILLLCHLALEPADSWLKLKSKLTFSSLNCGCQVLCLGDEGSDQGNLFFPLS